MVSALDAAQGALTLAGKANFDQSIWRNRNVTHWSTHVCMFGALVGGIALLIGITIDSIALATLGGFLFVTNSLASYYLKKFSVFFAIDEVIRALADTIKELYNQVVGLHNQIEAIGPIRERITDERKKIEQRLAESQATIEKLQKVVKDYQVVDKKLAQVVSVYQPLKQAVDEFISKVTQLEKSDLDFQRLNNALKALAKERTKLEDSIKKLEDGTKILDTHEKKIEVNISQLNYIMDGWSQRYTDIVDQNTRLAKEVDELTAQLLDFTSQNNKAEALVKQMEIICKELPSAEALRKMIEQIKSKA
jgi:DNA repair exonuclease SbcCD ATPase subunit